MLFSPITVVRWSGQEMLALESMLMGDFTETTNLADQAMLTEFHA